MKPSDLGCVLLALCLAAPCAGAGVIRGSIGVSARQSAADASRIEEGGQPSRPRLEDAVIYVEEIPDKVERKLARKSVPPCMAQIRHQFVPHVVAVVAGDSVLFENRDDVYHSLFSVSPVRRFDLGPCAPREARRVSFDTCGVVNLYCSIHPSTAGFVVAVPNRAFAKPTGRGHFALPQLPAGKYLVKAWHPGYGELRRVVEMPRRGDLVLHLSF